MPKRTVIAVSLNEDDTKMFENAKERVLQEIPLKYRNKYTNSEIMKMVLESFLAAESQKKVS